MKIFLRGCTIMLLLLTFKAALKAQSEVEETNLITRLSGLNTLNIIDAGKYFTDHGYTQFSKQTIQQATYSMDLYKYKTKDQPNSYILTVIKDQVCGSGYITYNEEDYQQALKIITNTGFEPSDAATPESGKTVYAKGNLRFLVQKKTAVNNSVFYVITLNDLLKIAQLAGFKK